MDDYSKFIVDYKISLSEAMQKIDSNCEGIVFLIDEESKLVGCITDGDIRRFLLAGGKVSDSVFSAANRSPKFSKTLAEAKVLYDEKNYISIPILDEKGLIVGVFKGESQEVKPPKSSLKIPVVINAGGKGTRLDPFTRVLPKPLIPVGDTPIIELIMKEYQKYDCKYFHIIVNYKKELMKAYFADCDNHYDIQWYEEQQPLGTGGGLSLLRGKMDRTFFFANCDALLTANYERMLAFHKENHNAITMICAYKNINIPYGVIEMGLNGRIESMKEKPLMSFLTNTGIYIVEPEVIDDIKDGVSIGFPDIVDMERQKGKNVAVFPVSENEWMDMGQLPELEKMRIKLYGE